MDTSTPPTQTTGFPHQAAKASWASAVIVVLLLMFGGRIGAKVIIEMIALLLIVVGLVLGVIALFGIRKHGTRGILAPALVGILINGLLVFIFVTNFLAARAKARRAATTAASPVIAVSSGTHDRSIKDRRNERQRNDSR